jgi:hypothetical protein
MSLTRTEKICSKCFILKPVTEFIQNKECTDGHTNVCHKCNNKYWKEQRKLKPKEYAERAQKSINKHSHRIWARNTLFDHNKKGYKINIKLNDLEKLAKETIHCLFCKTPLDWSRGKKGGPKYNSPSLDRMNNEKNLTLNNVMIICKQCNASKQNRNLEEFVSYCKNIENNILIKDQLCSNYINTIITNINGG